ncbi:MAG: hypothetical protein LBB64_04515, partial [Dysgonamonadaceae bacterium]|nr:hypothetical protein [Dysgonamonadaceae bacterium]
GEGKAFFYSKQIFDYFFYHRLFLFSLLLPVETGRAPSLLKDKTKRKDFFRSFAPKTTKH